MKNEKLFIKHQAPKYQFTLRLINEKTLVSSWLDGGERRSNVNDTSKHERRNFSFEEHLITSLCALLMMSLPKQILLVGLKRYEPSVEPTLPRQQNVDSS